MSRDEDARVRGRLKRYYRALGRVQSIAGPLHECGRLARVLAGSKPGGLLLSVDAPELSFYVADGMDITSQLVSVIHDESRHRALKGALSDDIRISVHAQHPVEFFGDVRDHRFDLMCFGHIDAIRVELAAAGLAPGGLLAVFPGDAPARPPQDDLARLLAACGLSVAPSVGGALLCSHSPGHLTAKRRGGRRRRRPIRG